jgi:predicted NUDIX family phosphoesterase
LTEAVMVVKREDLARWLTCPDPMLLRESLDDALEIIAASHFFIPRPEAEKSPQYKQIIPYVVIRHGESYFVLRRTKKQTEARLHDKVSLGIGGHINPDTPTVIGGLRKELDEEVTISSDYHLRFVGLLNDDTTEVGQVHLGAVYFLEVTTPSVVVRETEKMIGGWTPRGELSVMREAMESWSQIVFDELIQSGVRRP